MAKRIVFAVLILGLGFFFVCNQWSKQKKESPAQKKDSIALISSPLSVEAVKGKSGELYTFIYKNSASIDFEILRPSPKDSNVYLCIAGAFTTLDSLKIDGLYICKGKTGNKNKINHGLGGGIKIMDGECEIFPTYNGKNLNDSLISMMENKKTSFFQQIQCITNGKPATFKDKQLFQRRGIAIVNDGKTAVVESNKMITLKTFAEDLAELGVKNLLYSDMGFWDEGWYKLNGKIISIGHYLSQTDKQSNWVVFRK